MFNLISEDRNSQGRISFQSWKLFATPWFDVCLDHFLLPDDRKHLHNHSRWYGSLILWGGYVEEQNNGKIARYGMGSLVILPLNAYHRVFRVILPTWSLLLRGQKQEAPWGYLVDGQHIPHQQYRS